VSKRVFSYFYQNLLSVGFENVEKNGNSGFRGNVLKLWVFNRILVEKTLLLNFVKQFSCGSKTAIQESSAIAAVFNWCDVDLAYTVC
jgi:hypothetical protein